MFCLWLEQTVVAFYLYRSVTLHQQVAAGKVSVQYRVTMQMYQSRAHVVDDAKEPVCSHHNGGDFTVINYEKCFDSHTPASVNNR